MRSITSHQTNECNEQITVRADAPNHGNASHVYDIAIGIDPADGHQLKHVKLEFQKGPIKEFGVNGITNEVLIAVVIDRLQGFQSGPYACRENAIALTKLQEAAMWLESRTKARTVRGVEGTHLV